MADHAMANTYSNEPDYIWWVRKSVKKNLHYCEKVKSKCQNNIFKFGVKVDLTVEYALRIDW